MTPQVKEARAKRLEGRVRQLEAAQKRWPHKAKYMQPSIDGLRKEIEVLRGVQR